MTTTQRREKFKKTFAKVPIMMLQGSVGERIKRNFTHQDPTPPLKLAGDWTPCFMTTYRLHRNMIFQ